MYCERAEHLKQKGIDTEIYCHCSDDVDFECTALDMLKATIEHLAGCCEKGFPKDVATTLPVVSKKLSEIRYNIKQIVACIEHWESKDQVYSPGLTMVCLHSSEMLTSAITFMPGGSLTGINLEGYSQ